MKVLFTGRRSFVAEGFGAALEAAGHTARAVSADAVDEEEVRSFAPDAVVNFGFVRAESPAVNADRLRDLGAWCAQAGARRFLHVSSMSVYPPDAARIGADTPPARDGTGRGHYAAVKIAQERALEDFPVPAVVVRPGVVYEGRWYHSGGLRKGPFLLGDSGTTLPVVTRGALHARLLALLDEPDPPRVVVLAEARTKGWFAREVMGMRLVPLPRGLVTAAADALAWLHLFPESRARQVRALFRRFELEV